VVFKLTGGSPPTAVVEFSKKAGLSISESSALAGVHTMLAANKSVRRKNEVRLFMNETKEDST